MRKAIVELREHGYRTYEEIAALLDVGRATVSRVLRLHRESGSVAPRPRSGGNRSPIRGRIATLLVAIVSKMPDATVAELTEALEKEASISTSRSSVQRAIQRLGYSKKDPVRAVEQTRPSTGRGVASSARSSRR
ncbi:helix-turn-helix domain-containing protein [Sandaracinus amylolyticus]|uniref:helix-turn-helix domain-containing protein n=1 Tax=Sandaracinus amylolyticus TaxID=927083 RepID=UPI00069DE86D|nr:helix-turn-helix domain-containing protein [Sandaracinus amylolyticus]